MPHLYRYFQKETHWKEFQNVGAVLYVLKKVENEIKLQPLMSL